MGSVGHIESFPKGNDVTSALVFSPEVCAHAFILIVFEEGFFGYAKTKVPDGMECYVEHVKWFDVNKLI